MVREQEDLPQFTISDAEPFRDQDLKIDRVLTLFEAKTRGDRLPCRADVVPSELADLLPNVVLINAIRDDKGTIVDAILALMGTTVVEFYGEFTGKSIFEHPAPQVAERILKSMLETEARRKPVVAEAFQLSDEKSYLRVRILYVPLEDNGAINRFFLLSQVRSNVLGTPMGS